MPGLWRTKEKAGYCRLFSGGIPERSVVFLFALVLDDLGLADQHRPALELVQGLHQLEVLVAAEFGHLAVGGRLLGFFLGLLARFLAGLLADGILHFGPLAAAQVLVQ